jgi:glucose/arabinose dehydrogenase/cytochrome c2
MLIRHSVAALIALCVSASALGADANAGKNVFRQQCALCHSAEPNDGGGAQGPLLHNVFGRGAATGSDFSYTPALKSSKLTWDAATLDRFLTSPTTVVAGSAMVIPVASNTDRENLIAYFQALKEGTFKEAARPAGFGPPPGAAPPPPPAGEAEWKKDAPGAIHKVDLSKLPAPFASAAAMNFPRVVPKPASAKLSVPKGFKVDTFAAEGLQGPREMKVAPNGDIFLVETNAGRIKVLRMDADGKLAGTDTFAQGLLQPYGMQLYPATNPQWLYVAEVNRVVRYAYKTGQRAATAVPEVVVPQLSPVGGGHFTRDLQFSRDGKTMYVSVGSQGNIADGPNDMPKKTPAEIQAWEKERGLGAAWGVEENRAAVLSFDMANLAARPKLYATGIRNCVSLTMQPGTDQLWCTTNERDNLGDNLVPDYSTRVKPGAYYGWPWYYMGDHEDPRHAGARPDLKGKATLPDVPYTAHSAAVNLDFYGASTGKSAFPAEYVGEGLAVLHGSWNRGHRTGHKVVRVKMKNGAPTGEYQDFLTGFIVDDAGAWGRPVALAQMPDGSLLLSDDGTNQIYRISYSR